MEVDAPLRPRIRVTLGQFMKLVIFCAVASACVAPMFHLWRVGVAQGSAVIVLEGVVVPLVLAGLSFFLIRRGPWKEDLIAFLLLCSVSVAFGFAVWLFVFYTIPTYSDPKIGAESRTSFSGLMLHCLVNLTLAAAVVVLLVGLVRRFVQRTRRARTHAPLV
jgi:hypothetical protein